MILKKAKALLNNKDVLNRIIFTIGILLVFKIGTAISIPNVMVNSSDGASQGGYFDLLNLLGGGALEQFSIFALGVSPYITASIVTSLLSIETVLPGLAELSKQGEAGRKKIEQANRYLTLLLGAVQAYTIIINAQNNGMITKGTLDAYEIVYIVMVLLGGTFFVMWLADQVSTKGIGNGVSMIIFAGCITSIPTQFTTAFSSFLPSMNATMASLVEGAFKFVVYCIAYLIVVGFVVFIERAERRLPVQYSVSSSNVSKDVTYLPIKVNSASVIPVIFASAILTTPSTIASFITGGESNEFLDAMSSVTSIGILYKGVYWGTIIYLVLTFMFTFIYSAMQVDPEKINENFQNSGAYIPGVRPGNETIKYVSKVLYQVTFIGAVGLLIIAALPIFIPIWFSISSSMAMGGTGLIIVVGVAIETSTQIDGYLTGNDYKGFVSD